MYFWAGEKMSRKKAPTNRRRISRVEGIRGAGSVEVPLVVAAKRHSLLSSSTHDSKISGMNVGELEQGIAVEEAVGLLQNGGQLIDIVMSIILALAVRTVFMIHSLSVIWMTMEYRNDNSVWIFALVSLSMAVEGAMCVMSNGGHEKKWFSPCIMLYILATVPPMWLLETNQVHQESNIERHGDMHFLFLDQIVLILLIFGRWLLPSGRVSKEQLSQILLANVAIATDIGDFYGLLSQRTVYSSRPMQQLVLSAWTISLFQFPLILTSSGARKARIALTHNKSTKDATTIGDMLSDISVVAILVAHALQDIPFLAVRLYMFIFKRMVSKAMIFFICKVCVCLRWHTTKTKRQLKNVLIVVLQTYRLYAIYRERYSSKNDGIRSRDTKARLFEGKKRLSHGRDATDKTTKKKQRRWRHVSAKAAHKSKSNESTALREEREIPIKLERETSEQQLSKNQRRKMSAIDDLVVRQVVPGHYHLASGVDLTPPGRELLRDL